MQALCKWGVNYLITNFPFTLPGLLLVPNGESLGYAMGDFNPYELNSTIKKPITILSHRATASDSESFSAADTSHPWGVFFTIIGTVLLDFDADACQSPSRAYLLDVCVPSDHAKGLSTFTIMAGLGGFMGYSLGAINWEETTLGKCKRISFMNNKVEEKNAKQLHTHYFRIWLS